MPTIIFTTILLGALGVAQTPEPASTDIDRLSWMTGSWVMEHGGARVEEHWTPPRAGTMMGVGRTIKGDKTVFFEFLRIEATPDGIVYLASPRGRDPATPFKMIELTDGKVVFENPEHDFPNRITYWRESADTMGAKIEGKQGKPQSWIYRRAKDQ